MSKFAGIARFKHQFVTDHAKYTANGGPIDLLTYHKLNNKPYLKLKRMNPVCDFRKRKRIYEDTYYVADIFKHRVDSNKITNDTTNLFKDNPELLKDAGINDDLDLQELFSNYSDNIIIDNSFLKAKNASYRAVLLDAVGDYTNNYYCKYQARLIPRDDELKPRENEYRVDDFPATDYVPNLDVYRYIVKPVTSCIALVNNDGTYFCLLPVVYTTNSYYSVTYLNKSFKNSRICTSVAKIMKLLKAYPLKVVHSCVCANHKYNYYECSNLEFLHTSNYGNDSHHYNVWNDILTIVPHKAARLRSRSNYISIMSISDKAETVDDYLSKNFKMKYDVQGRIHTYFAHCNKCWQAKLNRNNLQYSNYNMWPKFAPNSREYKYRRTPLSQAIHLKHTTKPTFMTRTINLKSSSSAVKPLMQAKDLNQVINMVSVGNQHQYFVINNKVISLTTNNDDNQMEEVHLNDNSK